MSLKKDLQRKQAHREQMQREQAIFDKGYDAIRLMAKEMVANGASLADILFHANQVWHEFKGGAVRALATECGRSEALPVINGVIGTGMYIHSYDEAATDKVLAAHKRYENGMDAARVAQFAANPQLCEQAPPMLVRRAAATQ